MCYSLSNHRRRALLIARKNQLHYCEISFFLRHLNAYTVSVLCIRCRVCEITVLKIPKMTGKIKECAWFCFYCASVRMLMSVDKFKPPCLD